MAVKRILQLLRIHAYLDFMWMTRDARYFVICYVSDFLLTAASVTAMLLLAERFDGIGHWSKFQVIFMLGYAATVGGLLNIFFGFNILVISRRLGRGQLDHTLIQPQPVWMTLLTEGFTPFQCSCDLLPGVALLVWAVSRLPFALSLEWLVLFALNMAGSCAIMLSFSFLWGSMAFWTPRAAEEISSVMLRMLSDLKLFPLDGLGPALTAGLMTALPVGFLAWYPCRFLLGLDNIPWHGGLTPLVGMLFISVTSVVFRKGMKHYGKTGSQRYSGWGHRS